ncbi:glycosyltransferase [Nisaea nitritireducens]|uniref:glycosyltransferase n=1 Tax=Nisaea nitritireducens TaxID=568392 RepID=UPI001D029682|nr:glycosyltransferase [Nisaea nitritireducens]
MSNHVVQIVQHLRPGGLECLVLDLLRRSHCRSTIISLEGSREEAVSAWPRLQEISDRILFMEKPPGLSPRLVFSLAQTLNEIGADVVHTHHVGPLLYGGAAARLAGISRLVHTEHDAWHLDSPRRRFIVRTAMQTFRPLLVADAPNVAGQMSHHLGFENIMVVPNGVDTQRFTPGDTETARARLGLPSGVPLFGIAARLEHVKGVDILIDAMTEFPELHLAIAGDGSEREALERRVNVNGMAGRIHFLGRVDAMVDFYRALDRFCLSSRAEGLPLSLLEAQACSIPVVATNVGGVLDAMDPGSGFIAARADQAAVVDAIYGSLARMQISNPRNFVMEHYSLDRMMTDYEELWHGSTPDLPTDMAAA